VKRPLSAAALVAALVTALSLTGCSLLEQAQAAPDPIPTPSATSATTEPTPSAESKVGSVKDEGDLPDPCTLLSDEQVKELTGRGITQRDEDGASAGDATRYCQWQQPGGQLAVFLSRTTPADYEIQIDGATEVDGLGERAYTLAGHLYVLYGTVQVDVYVRGDSDEVNLRKEKDVVGVLLPQI
jgi:hypothetical protein